MKDSLFFHPLMKPVYYRHHSFLQVTGLNLKVQYYIQQVIEWSVLGHRYTEKQIEDLNQEECAKRMQVSRQTFQNIIDSARKKVAIALTDGKAIKIDGGNYRASFCKFKCFNCGELYEINYEQDKHKCPSCGSDEVICSKKAGICKKWCDKNK